MAFRFTKQSGETHDYVFDWSEYFAERSDAYASHTVTMDPGITKVSDTFAGNDLRVVVSGGADGQTYKGTILLTTTTGVVEEEEFFVRIRNV